MGIYNGLNFYPIGSNGIVDVRDVARMIVQLISVEEDPEKKIICSNQNIAHYDLFCLLADQIGVPKPVKPLQGWVAYLGPYISSLFNLVKGKSTSYTSEALDIANVDFAYDNSISRKHFNFEYTPLEKTIAETCQSFMATYPRGIKLGILPI